MLEKKYRVAGYYRLSREDGNEESQSIQTQREIIRAYVKQKGWFMAEEYIDDGYSGTDFKRPNFQRLLQDIELGKIDLVITKDLSRLGRNYIQVGLYTEEYFPSHNIRYIALNDGYDSALEDTNDFVPFRNIINEWYAKDTSKKIRSVLDDKAKRGEPRNTVFPVFGYTYNEKYERIPDPETAPIVQLIYRKFLELGSTKKVADYLTDQKIKTPRYYNAIKYNYRKSKVLALPEYEWYRWTSTSVHDILVKEENLGVYKTAQSKSISFKNKKRFTNKDCYIFENRYEPLIDKATWMQAKKMLRVTQGAKVPISENPFRGIIYCADCGRLMRLEKKTNLKKMQFDYRYYCDNGDCEFNNSITKAMLESAVAKEFLELKNIILFNEDDFLSYAAMFDSTGRYIEADVESELEKAQARSAEIDVYIEKLFDQNVKGTIPVSTFNMLMAKYNREKGIAEDEIRTLQRKINSERLNPQNKLKATQLTEILKELDERNLTSAYIVQRLIKRIVVRTRFINNSNRNREIYLVVHYFDCDGIIKGFLENG